MNISGIVVYASPDSVDALRSRLEEMPGVEVHAAGADGKIVVTVEQVDGQGSAAEVFGRIAGIRGVLSTALAYHHSDPDAEGAT